MRVAQLRITLGAIPSDHVVAACRLRRDRADRTISRVGDRAGGFRRPFSSSAPVLAFARGMTLWTIAKGGIRRAVRCKDRITAEP